MPAKKTGLVKNTTDLAARPDYIKPSKGTVKGQEEFGDEDFVMPRISIAQSISTQVNKLKPDYIEGLEQGQYFNTLTKEVYGDEMKAVPLWGFLSRMKFTDDKKNLECTSKNGKDGGTISPTCAECPHAQFIDGEPPACIKLLNFIMMNPETQDIAAFSFKKTSYKAGKTLNSLIRMRQAEATYAGIYKFKTHQEDGDLGSYFVPDVANAGWVDPELYEHCDETVSALRVQADKIADSIHDNEASSRSATNTVSDEDVPY